KTPAIAMKQRYRPQVDRTGVQAVLQHFADRIHVGPTVREHHALWKACGTAGVVDADDPIFLARRCGAKGKLALFEQRFVIVGNKRQLLELVQHGLNAREKLWIGYQDLGSAVIQYPSQLTSLQASIQHHQHRTQQRYSEME